MLLEKVLSDTVGRKSLTWVLAMTIIVWKRKDWCDDLLIFGLAKLPVLVAFDIIELELRFLLGGQILVSHFIITHHVMVSLVVGARKAALLHFGLIYVSFCLLRLDGINEGGGSMLPLPSSTQSTHSTPRH